MNTEQATANSWVYIKSEPGLWTVGFYKPDGKWEPESDHESQDFAARRIHYLNGGKDDRHRETIKALVEALELAMCALIVGRKVIARAIENLGRLARLGVELAELVSGNATAGIADGPGYKEWGGIQDKAAEILKVKGDSDAKD